ncbi:MAG: hypothetical protein AAB632_01145 [Patescibacteria group bacterium]
MTKGKPTKTTNPIHFEDLDPHRFEDLVRRLIYDFNDWQNIEPTGRGGADDGYDARGWERIAQENEEEDGENIESKTPMDGNLWMIQCKRLKNIGPKKIKEIISEIPPKEKPYGYILAASVNFSKKSYDIFREEIRKRGVMEFYLWGKTEIEDMVYMPKNDQILFTFFGTSLAVRRRSLTSEVKSSIIMKNRMMRIMGENHSVHGSVLVRDIKDREYPYTGEYEEKGQKPRWEEYQASQQHPLGLIVHIRKFYAYIDEEKKTFDFSEYVDLSFKPISNQRNGYSDEDSVKKEKIADFCRYLPRKNRAELYINGIIYYKDILILDPEGDFHFKCPHIFLDLDPKMRLPIRIIESFKAGDEEIDIDEYKRVKVFPTNFPSPKKKGKVYKNKLEDWDSRVLDSIARTMSDIYDIEDKLKLKTGDAVLISESTSNEKTFGLVTYKHDTTVGKWLKGQMNKERSLISIEE